MRAMNLVDELVSRGHEVVLWSAAFHHQERQHRCREFRSIVYSNKLTINLIPSQGYTRNIGIRRLIDHAQMGFNLWQILKSERFEIPNVAFVGFPPIETSAVMLRWLNIRHVPTMIDAKDQWPLIFLEPLPIWLRSLGKLAIYPYYSLARRALKDASAFCSMFSQTYAM